MRIDDKTLIEALRILARDIQSDDGIANAAIAEAADRIEELNAKIKQIHKSFGCELRDPNGTIWEHAARLQQENAVLSAKVKDMASQGIESAIRILQAKWDKMLPSRYVTIREDETDEAWMNGFLDAIEFLKQCDVAMEKT